MKKRFCLNSSLSPTYYNVSKALQKYGWCFTRYLWRSHFNEQHCNFHVDAAECLEYKHLLAQIVIKFCPHVMPETYCINDTNWPLVLGDVGDISQHSGRRGEPAWILKPSLLNNGQHIKLFERFDQLEKHYLSSNRMGGEHVLQRYITEPDLINGHKYSIRMFVIITNYAGAFVYPSGYYNVANHPYSPNQLIDLRPHLTNEHLHDDESNVTQVPTRTIESFPLLYQQIKSILASVMGGLTQIYPEAFVCKKQRTCAIFGFDFMVDTDRRVWLLEANHGPCFPTCADHPMQKPLYDDFWQAFTTRFVMPMGTRQAIKQSQYLPFEHI